MPLPQLLVRVQMQGASAKQPVPTTVTLSDIDGGAGLNIAVPSDGNLFLPRVPPGRYRIAVGQKTQLPIVTWAAKGAALQSGRFDIPQTGRVELTLVIDASATDLHGRVIRGGHGEPGTLVMLVPRDGWEDTTAYRFDQSDSDGTFVWQGVAKKDYLMFTLDSGEPEDYADPEVVRGLLPKGRPVA